MQTLSSISSFVQTAVEYGSMACVTAYTTAQPYMADAVQRIQGLWEAILPYLQVFVDFSSTRFGLSIDLLALSIVPFAISGCTKSTAATVALIATGVLMAGAGAFLISGLPLPGIIASPIV